jgi:peroxiredoxin
MPPHEGDRAPDITAVLADGETFRSTSLDDAVEGGAVLVFSAFVYSAIAENWWKHYERSGWGAFDVPVIGVTPDGPYAQNAFVRAHDLPFRFYSDVDGGLGDAYDLTIPREGMANVSMARRAIFVLDAERRITFQWLGDDWISPPPQAEVESAVEDL